MSGQIHDDHPFATPEAMRDPVRRFRGRLSAPVTIVTAGTPAEPQGLTVSSLVVAEGDPAYLYALISTETDLWPAIRESGGFVVHVLGQNDRKLSDSFAGMRPVPGGPFVGLELIAADAGPLIDSLPNRAHCAYLDHQETEFHALVRGRIDHVDVAELGDPLRYFRGGYA